MSVDYKVLPVEELNHFLIRDIRESIVDDLKERIGEEYNPARPLTIVEQEGEYLVADGNHRLKALVDLGVEEVPCVIHHEESPYSLAVKGNKDEDTYSPMDLFDWIELIDKMREEGMTQQGIADEIGWGRTNVANYIGVADKVVTPVLEKAKAIQNGRVTEDVTNVTFNFTEGWFRNLYNLEGKYQIDLMDNFISDKCNWNNNKVKREAAKYKQWMEFIEIAKDKLVDQSDLDEMVSLVENGNFRSETQLLNKLNDFNSEAENKLINGDSVIEMGKLDDNSIDLFITDPPYGIDYSSNRSEFSNHVTKEKIANDSNLQDSLDLFEDVLKAALPKMKADSHFYVFTSWKVYPEFYAVISKYLDVKNMIVWDKNNHGSGDLTGSWGNRHELVIFATKGNREINTRKPDIINVPKLASSKMIHPTQKPVGIIVELLEVSARPKDTVVDPFMGSGSTIKAVKEYGDLNYIGIELDEKRFNDARSFIGGD